MTPKTKKMNTEKLFYIFRLSDGLLYSHYDHDNRVEVWNKCGAKFTWQHSSVYLARLRPELYKIVAA